MTGKLQLAIELGSGDTLSVIRMDGIAASNFCISCAMIKDISTKNKDIAVEY
jgi:hypothetical protein